MRSIVAVTTLLIVAALAAPPPAATAGPHHDGPALGGALKGALEGALDMDRAVTVASGGATLWKHGGVGGVTRTVVAGRIAHYRFDLTVGPGEHDRIRLHRVVREHAPWFPAATPRAAFLAHGDGWGFEPTFLNAVAAPGVPADRSPAVVLAEAGVDVWGVDFRWALVPPETTGFSFMEPWGLGTSAEDLDLALALARSVRLLTGSGLGKLHLVGYSRGGTVGWIQLGAETQRPSARRHLRGFVAVDHTFKTADEAIRQEACAYHDTVQGYLDSGFYASGFSFVAEVGDLATAAPEEESPFFPGLSNADLAEWLGASAAGGAIPYLHSVGGLIDPETFETELLYTRPERWFTFLSAVSHFQPLRIDLDGAAILCDELDSPYDDHLAEIAVPVLYVGAAGAYGAAGLHTTTLIASADVSSLIVSETAVPEEDWGHNDLVLAEDGAALVWQPILDWIESH